MKFRSYYLFREYKDNVEINSGELKVDQSCDEDIQQIISKMARGEMPKSMQREVHYDFDTRKQSQEEMFAGFNPTRRRAFDVVDTIQILEDGKTEQAKLKAKKTSVRDVKKEAAGGDEGASQPPKKEEGTRAQL